MAREELGLAVHQLRGISLQCFGDPPVQLLSGIAQKSPVGCFLHQRVLEGIDRIGRNAALSYQLGSERAGRERLAARPREAWRPPDWFVYAKPPFAGPEAVLAYLARYTHRVAISNSRLVSLDERGVRFRYKDYCRNGRARFGTTTLMPNEFIRRFLLHVLPNGFHRIRHYGLLASATCKANLARAKELIAAPLPSIDPATEHDDQNLAADAAPDRCPPCPCCGGRMIIVESFGRGGQPRAPPSPQDAVKTATP